LRGGVDKCESVITVVAREFSVSKQTGEQSLILFFLAADFDRKSTIEFYD